MKSFIAFTVLTIVTIAACSNSQISSAPTAEQGEPFAFPSSETAATEELTETEDLFEISKWDLWSSDETMLRGANISQAIIIPELDGLTFKGPGPVGPPYAQEDFDRLAALGANYVSISGPGIYSIYPPYEILPEVVARYDQLLVMIAKADMFATVGFRTGPGRSDWSICCADADWAQPYLVDTVWQVREQQAAWVEMWRTAAGHFHGHPNVVAYKIMVEPNAAAQHFEIYDADEFFSQYEGATYDWNSWFPEIIAGIREVDTETPILVGADDFSSIDWLPYVAIVEDEKTAYYVDQYEPFTYTHQESQASFSYPGQFDTDFNGTSETFDLQWLQRHMSKVTAFELDTDRHATVEEFGVHRWAAGAADYLNDLIAIFENSNWNYAIWVWETEWREYTDEVNDFNWRFGTDPRNLVDLPNELQDVLSSYWALNRLRPSNVTWITE
jgi:hypothetical protein